MDKIYVNRMEFYGYHGVFSEETRLGQRFAVDLSVSIDLKKAGETDELEYSVNYAELYQVCKTIVEGPPFKLVEAVAERIAAGVLTGFPLISEVTVTVIKPDPPIPGHYRSVAVEITRRR
ncbi:dihydroneopterin aldolase [Neobacillus sp. MER 74]|uniref:dihydroneopterin aldolase n=1 Tax=Bacillaceae TaxID=186817 RepID=UPI000BF3C338|nr:MULTISPECIES: dihydroneopterin aldolase [Bacillaceae]MCM3118214.1 dihydroneopterin aldolase [Neobacillus sp. MER 74]PFP16068.1 dihydroneopterin aldolase [Bacillus sp. AFS073361]